MKLGQTSFISFASQATMSVAGFAANIVIANLLGPKIHGTYFLAVSLIYWLVLVGNMGLHKSIKKRVSEEGSSGRTLAAAVLAQIVLFLFVGACILLFAPAINGYVGAPVAPWILAMVIVTLAYNFVLVLLDGQHKVHLSSLLTPISWTIRSVVQIGLVVLSIGLTGLFIGYVVGGLVAVVIGLYFARIKLEMPTWEHVKNLYSYAKYSWVGSLSNQSFSSMDTIILGFFVVNDLIGVYEIAWNIASLFAIFGFAVSRAVFPEVSSMASEGHDRISEVVSASLAYAGLFLIPGLVGTIIVGDVVLTIYGRAYVQGYYVLTILTLARLVNIYLGMFLTTLDALNRPEISFRIQIIFLLANLVLNVVLINAIGWTGAAIATASSASIGLVFGYRGLSNAIKVSLPLREIGRQVVAALIMGIIVYSIRMTAGDSLPTVLLSILIGAAIYFGTLSTLSPQFRKTVIDNLPQSVPRP